MFEKAIEDLFSSKEIVSDPIPFQPYISQIGLKNIKTADFISINDISQLRPELKENKCTVLRLGAGERGYTRFALVQMDSWDDYFHLILQPIDGCCSLAGCSFLITAFNARLSSSPFGFSFDFGEVLSHLPL